MGLRLRSGEERVGALKQESEEAFYTSPGQQVGAVLEATQRGGTLGLSGLAERAVGSGADDEAYRKRQAYNPGKTTAAEIGAAVIPSVLSGGAGLLGAGARATGPGAAAALGARIAKGGAEGAGFAARAARTGAAFATEGAIQGAGQGVSELALAKDPLTLERAVSVIGSNALYGGAAGGVLGAGGSLVASGARTVAKGLAKSRDLIAKAGNPAAAGGADFVESLALQKTAAADSGAWLVMQGKARGRFGSSEKAIERALDTPLSLQKSPGSMLRPLEKNISAIEETLAGSAEALEKLAKQDVGVAKEIAEQVARLTDDAAEVTLSGKSAERYGTLINRKVAKEIAVSRAEAARLATAIEAGEVHGLRQTAFSKMPALLEQRKAVFAQVQNAVDELAGAGKKGIAQEIMGNYLASVGTGIGYAVAGPLGGAVGAAAGLVGRKAAGAVTNLVFARGAKAIEAAGARTSKAVDAFMTTGKRIAPAMPPLATRTLNSVSFAPEAKTARGETPPTYGKGEPALLAAYRKREAEIYSQITTGPDGKLAMRPEARRKVAERLAPMHVLSPLLADKVETHAAKRIEFLASKLPKRPDIAAMNMGPDQWRPSNLEMRRFARYVAAAEDPGAIEERAADGTVSPEDAETYQALYPERLADLQRQITERMPELRAQLPYSRRLSLSILTGVPLVPAMDPEILKILQAQYTNEPGTEGGMEAPVAAPQFGSIQSSEKPTPSQERSA